MAGTISKGFDSSVAEGRLQPALYFFIRGLIIFGQLRNWPYLCDMNTLYLKTPTDTLTTPFIRKIVLETIKWCQENMGVKKHRKFTYHVLTLKDGPLQAYGMFDPATDKLIIFRNYTKTVKDIIRVVIHEYTHYLQNLRWYGNTLQKVGYYKHPQEIEAHSMECYYSVCWKEIKTEI